MATTSWEITSFSHILNPHILGPQTHLPHPFPAVPTQGPSSPLTWNSYLRGLPTSSTVFMPDSPITVPPKKLWSR